MFHVTRSISRRLKGWIMKCKSILCIPVTKWVSDLDLYIFGCQCMYNNIWPILHKLHMYKNCRHRVRGYIPVPLDQRVKNVYLPALEGYDPGHVAHKKWIQLYVMWIMLFIRNSFSAVQISLYTKHKYRNVAIILCSSIQRTWVVGRGNWLDCRISDGYLIFDTYDRYKFYCAPLDALFHTKRTFDAYLRYYRTDYIAHHERYQTIVSYPNAKVILENITFYWPILVLERLIRAHAAYYIV